jgi:pyruvate/2-oxoglutarate/acetoin dehydrogenase E1 component
MSAVWRALQRFPVDHRRSAPPGCSRLPLDLDTIVASVGRANRLVAVHEGCKSSGFGGEIAASVTEAAFDWLDAPVARVGAPDVPMRFNDRLERAVIPSAERIVAAVKGLFGDA